MTVTPRHDFKPCAPGAFAGGLRRTEFFDGMVLSEADMKREQTYWGMKRRLTNRALGQGVVWGLNVVWDDKTRCFTVCPGYALSCCGDDLVVECPETVCEPDLIDPCSKDFKHLFAEKADPCNCDPDPRGPVSACLLLEYVECPEDPRQVFEDICAEVAGGCRYGAVRETTRLRIVPPPPPPPSSPIEEFCAKIAGIREALAEETGAALPDPAFDTREPRLRLEMEGIDANRNSLGTRTAALDLPEDAAGTTSTTVVLTGAGAIDEIAVRLTPPPGWAFASVTVDNDPPREIETMMGFETLQTRSGLDTYTNRLDLRMIPFAGGDTVYRAVVELDGRASEAGLEVVATVASVRREEKQADCLSLLENWLVFQTDPRCILRTLSLAMLCGWFRGQIGTPSCAPAKDDPEPVREALAWMMCWVAWRMYWGIDISSDRARGVERCLQKLFETWCEGFHYKGPRCEWPEHHGVILGCMKISPRGKILCFDPWEHRRHVLTGPLVNHWGGQLGLAPLDVIAGRLAGWICCVARSPMPQMPEGGPDALSGLLPFGAMRIKLGAGFGISDTVAGARVAAVHAPGPNGFVGAALSALSQADMAAADGGAVEVISAPGNTMHLVVPSALPATAHVSPSRRVVEDIAAPEVTAVSPMARRATVEMIEELTRETPLSRLKLAGDSAAHSAVLDVLEAEEVTTVENLLARDADSMSDKIRVAMLRHDAIGDAETAEKTLGQVYGAAARLVRAAGAAIGTEGAGRDEADPLTRADIAEAGTVAAVRTAVNAHLKSRGMSEAAVRALAKRVAARR